MSAALEVLGGVLLVVGSWIVLYVVIDPEDALFIGARLLWWLDVPGLPCRIAADLYRRAATLRDERLSRERAA